MMSLKLMQNKTDSLQTNERNSIGVLSQTKVHNIRNMVRKKLKKGNTNIAPSRCHMLGNMKGTKSLFLNEVTIINKLARQRALMMQIIGYIVEIYIPIQISLIIQSNAMNKALN